MTPDQEFNRAVLRSAGLALTTAVTDGLTSNEIEILRRAYVAAGVLYEVDRLELAFAGRNARRAVKPTWKGIGAAERINISADFDQRSDALIFKARLIREHAEFSATAAGHAYLANFAAGAAHFHND